MFQSCKDFTCYIKEARSQHEPRVPKLLDSGLSLGLCSPLASGQASQVNDLHAKVQVILEQMGFKNCGPTTVKRAWNPATCCNTP